MYNFFLSYSRDANIEIIEKYMNTLEDYGFKLWYDKLDVILSKNIISELYATLSKCKKWDGLILFLDATYFKKEWCIKELDYALNNDITIYPILLGITKNDIPETYKELTKLNLCTIKNINDIDYAIYKTLHLFLNDKNKCVAKTNHFQNAVLNDLILQFKNRNQQTNEIILIGDNIALCVKYLLIDKGEIFDGYLKIFYNIIHQTAKQYYLKGKVTRYQIRIVVKATQLLIDTYC